MEPLPLPAFNDNYIWVLRSSASDFICVDPGDAEPVIRFAAQENLSLSAILITHHHADHAGGILALQKKFPQVQVFAPIDARIMGDPRAVQDKDLLTLAHFNFRILAIPGHTSTHIAYYESNLHWLFCGDTLFSAGCGRVFDGTIEALFSSLNRLATLPEETLVFAAHEYTLQNLKFAQLIEPENQHILNYIKKMEGIPCTLPSTLAIEKSINPFLRSHIKSLQACLQKENPTLTHSFSIFKHLREKKDNFKG